MRLWPKRKPRTYYIGGGRDLDGRDVQPNQPGPDWVLRFGIALAAVAAVMLVVALSWVIVVYAVQGKPTQRQRDRASIARQEVEITQLRQRIDSLSLRLDELERR